MRCFALTTANLLAYSKHENILKYSACRRSVSCAILRRAYFLCIPLEYKTLEPLELCVTKGTYYAENVILFCRLQTPRTVHFNSHVTLVGQSQSSTCNKETAVLVRFDCIFATKVKFSLKLILNRMKYQMHKHFFLLT